MSDYYKHIAGDLYEFKEMTTGDRYCIRLSCVEEFCVNDGFKPTEEFPTNTITTIDTKSGDHTSIIVPYEEFKELMRLYIENEMLEKARMAYPINIPSVFEPRISYDKDNPPKWLDTGELPTVSITWNGEKKEED